LTLHPGLPELAARIIAEVLRRSLETTLGISCEAPTSTGLVSFIPLLGSINFPEAVSLGPNQRGVRGKDRPFTLHTPPHPREPVDARY
jgi:hypothetical protein